MPTSCKWLISCACSHIKMIQLLYRDLCDFFRCSDFRLLTFFILWRLIPDWVKDMEKKCQRIFSNKQRWKIEDVIIYTTSMPNVEYDRMSFLTEWSWFEFRFFLLQDSLSNHCERNQSLLLRIHSMAENIWTKAFPSETQIASSTILNSIQFSPTITGTHKIYRGICLFY